MNKDYTVVPNKMLVGVTRNSEGSSYIALQFFVESLCHVAGSGSF